MKAMSVSFIFICANLRNLRIKKRILSIKKAPVTQLPTPFNF